MYLYTLGECKNDGVLFSMVHHMSAFIPICYSEVKNDWFTELFGLHVILKYKNTYKHMHAFAHILEQCEMMHGMSESTLSN